MSCGVGSLFVSFILIRILTEFFFLFFLSFINCTLYTIYHIEKYFVLNGIRFSLLKFLILESNSQIKKYLIISTRHMKVRSQK